MDLKRTLRLLMLSENVLGLSMIYPPMEKSLISCMRLRRMSASEKAESCVGLGVRCLNLEKYSM